MPWRFPQRLTFKFTVCRPIALLNGVGQLIARNLNNYLEALGIRAIFMSAGPVAPPARENPTDA